MKVIIILLLALTSISSNGQTAFKKPVAIEKVVSVDASIEAYLRYASAMYYATSEDQRASARAIINGVTNPVDFNDPNLQSKVEDFFTYKQWGCVSAGAVCAVSYFQCIKRYSYPNPPAPPNFCEIGYALCLGQNGCNVPVPW